MVQNDKATWWQTKHNKLIRQKTVKVCGKTFTKLAVKEHRQRLTTQLLEYGNSTENDLEKANAFTFRGSSQYPIIGPIFDNNFKKVVDDKIAENYNLFNPLASYVDEKGDENPIMGHISLSEI